jgi:hypothetical protein
MELHTTYLIISKRCAAQDTQVGPAHPIVPSKTPHRAAQRLGRDQLVPHLPAQVEQKEARYGTR